MRFSLVIPLAPERNIKILDSINNLNFPKEEFEIIVKVGKNPSINRNQGIKESKGEIIAFLDDDAVVHKDLLKNADEFFKNHPDHSIVGGPQLTTKNESFFGKYSGFTLESFFGTMSMSTRYKLAPLNLNADESHLTSANLFVKKKVFESLKPFNPDLFPGEDPEFLARAKKNNLKIAYSPNLIIYHKRRDSPKSFLKQFFNYGKTRLQKEKVLGSKPSITFFAPALFLLYLLFLTPLILISTLFILPLFLYISVNLFFSMLISFKHKSPLSLITSPFIFFLLHISYGAGMLYYLIKNL